MSGRNARSGRSIVSDMKLYVFGEAITFQSTPIEVGILLDAIERAGLTLEEFEEVL